MDFWNSFLYTLLSIIGHARQVKKANIGKKGRISRECKILI
ncbi:MAG: hypothetical protein BAJALOKI2v1_190018 [Promethearchaeota archaeon]|nr:MAG: hypothetical protein BAJALOKI2v1_190018 [Candidatus Lokiarchaeota archaeon]